MKLFSPHDTPVSCFEPSIRSVRIRRMEKKLGTFLNQAVRLFSDIILNLQCCSV